MSQNGKGDTQRPTDKKKFDNNYERIFGKKESNLTDELVFGTLQEKNPCGEISLEATAEFCAVTPEEDVIPDPVLDKIVGTRIDFAGFDAIHTRMLSALGIPSNFLKKSNMSSKGDTKNQT